MKVWICILAGTYVLRASALTDLAFQLRTPFETQFAAVTTDIAAQSAINLNALRAQMRAQRDYDKYLTRATDLAKTVDQDLAVTHGTSLASARAILKSGAVLSVDELIRRKIIPASSSGFRTDDRTDGQIGEQDVIFLSLAAKADENFYGAVVFEFDKKQVLDLGYFSMNSFAHGYAGEPWNPDRNVDQITGFMIQDYRPVVFKGNSDYFDLLTIAANNWLWINDHPTVLKDFDVAGNAIDREDTRAQQDLKSGIENSSLFSPITVDYNICPILLDLDQSTADKCPALNETMHLFEGMKYGLMDNIRQSRQATHSISDKVLASIILVPSYSQTHWPLASRPFEGYWEVKVPRELALATATRVTVQKANVSSSDLQALSSDIHAFAAGKSWRVEPQEDSKKITFVFVK